MVEIAKITTHKDRKIEVPQYGVRRVQRTRDGTSIKTPEYGFDAFEHIVDEIEVAREGDWDRIVLITGDEGSGKSALGAHLATRFGISDVSEVSFDGAHYRKRLSEVERESTTWLDEGSSALYSRDAMTRSSKEINKAFQMVRTKNLLNIICLPHMKLLDKDVRQRRVHYWAHTYTCGYDRGYSIWRIAGKKKREKGELRIPKHENEWNMETYWEPIFIMRFPKFKENNGFKWADYQKEKEKKLDEFLTISD